MLIWQYETGSEILVVDCFASLNAQIANITDRHCQRHLDMIYRINKISLQNHHKVVKIQLSRKDIRCAH